MIFCCKDCEKRHLGCHSDCPDYLADKARHDELKAKIDRERALDSGMCGARLRAIHAANRRRYGK